MNTAAALAPTTIPPLNPGEIYVGIVLEDGKPENARHVILQPNEKKGVNWSNAVKWAKEQSGELPTRMEMLLLFKTQCDLFSKDDPYWTSEPYAGYDAYAWYQTFGYGYQGYWRKDDEFRARAVRRVVI